MPWSAPESGFATANEAVDACRNDCNTVSEHCCDRFLKFWDTSKSALDEILLAKIVRFRYIAVIFLIRYIHV